MKRTGLILILYLISLVSFAQQKIEIDGAKGKSYWMETRWGKVYYEVFGEGEPLLILHGNGGSAKGKHHIIPRFLDDYMVIVMDSRCHGNSSCPEGDMDYFEMAKDVKQLMDELGHEKYTIWGHSDGGILGLILGYKYSQKISGMLLTGANAERSGLEPELVEMVKQYEKIPDPRMRKQVKLMCQQKPISIDSLKKVNTKVMLMVGDRDAVRMEHTVQLLNTLPMANLCVLPATTHFIDHEKPNHIEYWLRELKKPFKAPSTVKIAEQMAQSIFSEN